MSDEIKMNCQGCGKEFNIEPDSACETGMSQTCPCCDHGMSEAEVQEALDSGEFFTPEQLERMTEFELQEIGLTPAERDELLNTGEITTGAVMLCPDCLAAVGRKDPA